WGGGLKSCPCQSTSFPQDTRNELFPLSVIQLPDEGGPSFDRSISKLRFGPEIVQYPSHVRGRSSDECGRSAERIASSEAADSIMSSVRQWAAKQEDDLTVLVCDYVGDRAVEQGKES